MRILYNAQIRTQNPGQPFASAVAIDNGRILMTGSDSEVLNQFHEVKDRQDMHKQVIWPGLTDAHIHLQHYAFALQMVDCETDTQAECLRRVAEKARQVPAGTWVYGHGWNQNSWSEGFGTIKELDAVVSDKPVFLTAKSLHAAWANSAALRLVGINAATPDPEGGVIGRDEAGNPNGLLFETAMEQVYAKLPSPTQEVITQASGDAQQNLWQVGLTGVHDFDRSQCFTALQMLNQAG
ncbi:MAG: amidohydrolase family protein, partial [Anaerolineaceae bacterium]|nr:amidohydrolase family protein [Anaerolineaceae bacterium]